MGEVLNILSENDEIYNNINGGTICHTLSTDGFVLRSYLEKTLTSIALAISDASLMMVPHDSEVVPVVRGGGVLIIVVDLKVV